jgi:hypothetical protein
LRPGCAASGQRAEQQAQRPHTEVRGVDGAWARGEFH